MFSKIFYLFVALLLASCVLEDKKNYEWRGYNHALNLYYTNGFDSIDKQINYLKSSIERLKSTPERTPPGLYAQLGLLYSINGDHANAKTCFENEKLLFKESKTFMDLLLKSKVQN